MELEHSFTIPVPPEQAFRALLDVERVAPCMPGATVDSVEGDVITGRIKVKVGPVTLTYAGKAHFRERDERTRSVILEASGRETRGTGTATATVRSVLRGEGGQTEVIVHTHLAVTGRPAQFGRGMLTEVGGRIIDMFAANLAAQLAAGQPAGMGNGNGAGPEVPASGPAPAASADSAATGAAAGAAATGGAASGGTGSGGAAGAETPVGELNLPVRAAASLRLAGITTVGALAARDESTLLGLAGIGPQTIRQIRRKLAERGLTLAAPAAGEPGERPGEPGAERPGAVAEPGAAIAPPGTRKQVSGATPAPAVSGPAGQAELPAQAAPSGTAPPQAAPSGTAPPQAAPSGTAPPQGAPAPDRPPLRPVRPLDEEAIDLLNVAGLPVLKRIVPAAGVLAALVAVLLVLLRRHRRGPRGGASWRRGA